MDIILLILIILIILILYWRFFFFFRDPERTIPPGENIVAPADGIIIYIKRIKEGEIPIVTKGKDQIKIEELTKVANYEIFHSGYIIGIFMTLFSVHINRAPIAGKVEKIQRFKGKNISMARMTFNKFFGKKPLYSNCGHIIQNERNTIILKGKFPLCLVQIADLYVSKIKCWVKVNQIVEKGQKIGMIRMGSQVDVIFPALGSIEIKVKEGQSVKAGESVLAVLEQGRECPTFNLA
jgi:phosphatidylserine decarboxylase